MDRLNLPILAWIIFIAAAALEVAGDAVVRKGLRSTQPLLIGAGCGLLAGYGLVVNLVKWDFSKLLGVYVAIFAVISVLSGKLIFQEDVPVGTWIGLGLIVAGGLVIQFTRP
jgi:small multidrug resistance family-3 protein